MMENRESRDLKSLPLDLLKEKMTELSEKPFRAKQLYDWMHVKLAGDYDEMTNLSAALRNRLKEEYPLTTLRVVREQTSAIDGTKKFLFALPENHRSEVHVVFDNYAKYISRPFPDKEALMADKEVLSTRCYLCHHNLRKKVRWFSPNGKHYYSLSWCDKHGWMKGKIRVKKAEDDMVYAVKTTKLVGEKEVAALMERKDHIRQLRKEHRHREAQEKLRKR